MLMQWEIAIYSLSNTLYVLDNILYTTLQVADEVASALRTGDFSSLIECYNWQYLE